MARVKVKLGHVMDYFIHMGVLALKLEDKLALGDVIHIRGVGTDIVQKVEWLQIGPVPVRSAKPGEMVGIKAEERVQPGAAVYKIVPAKTFVRQA